MCVIVWAGCAWAVAGQGLFRACLTVVATLVAGTVALNVFEPASGIVLWMVPAAGSWTDLFVIILTAAGVGFGVFQLLDRLWPQDLELAVRTDSIARWSFGVIAGYFATGLLLTAMHTAPVPKGILGFSTQRRNVAGLFAPDRTWLTLLDQMQSSSLRRRVQLVEVVDGRELLSERSLPSDYFASLPDRYAMQMHLRRAMQAETPVDIETPANEQAPQERPGRQHGEERDESGDASNQPQTRSSDRVFTAQPRPGSTRSIDLSARATSEQSAINANTTSNTSEGSTSSTDESDTAFPTANLGGINPESVENAINSAASTGGKLTPDQQSLVNDALTKLGGLNRRRMTQAERDYVDQLKDALQQIQSQIDQQNDQ
jgi:hypothetical protein